MFLSPLFLSMHEGTVHGTNMLTIAWFVEASGVIQVYSRGWYVSCEK